MRTLMLRYTFATAVWMASITLLPAQEPVETDRIGVADEIPPWPQNRLRTFYADQARRFLREQGPLPDLLPEFPGLDGGTFGHWGQYPTDRNQEDAFNHIDFAGMVSTVTRHFGTTTSKAIVVQPGAKGDMSAVFDPTRLSFRDVWDGPLVRFNQVMFGLINPGEPRGDQLLDLQASAWNVSDTVERRYLGLYRHGRDVVFSYQIGDARVLDHAWKLDGHFARGIRVQGKLPADTSLTLLRASSHNVTISTQANLQIARSRRGDEALLVVLRESPDNVRLTVAKQPLVRLVRKPEIRLEFVKPRGGDFHVAFFRVKNSQADALIEGFVRAPTPQLAELIQGGPSRWSKNAITTRGVVGPADGSYAVDTLTIPYSNPFNLRFRVSGVDFLPDGRCAVSVLGGDVWLIDGVDSSLDKLVWKRIAAGLHQPLGLLVREGKILVASRDQITRLHDLNGDDEADFYECVTNAYKTVAGHEFVTCLREDDQQNLYFSSAVEGVLKFDPEENTIERLGSGLRYCNGIEVSPDGKIVLATAQEGTWTPATAIFEVRDRSYHGFHGPRSRVGRYGYDLPLCYVPRGIDHSAGSLVFLPDDRRFGSLAGRKLGLSFGNCTHYLLLRERIGEVVQGGVVPLPGEFLSGAHRGRFNHHDGHLYIAGTSGWQNYAKENGSLQRLRYTGQPLDLPDSVETHENGLLVRFNCPIDPDTVKLENVFCEQWNYLYSFAYGSAEFSVRDPGRQGHDPVDVRSVHLLDDGRSVFVEIPQLHPVMQLHLYMRLRCVTTGSRDGGTTRDFAPDIYYTLYEMKGPFTNFRGYEKIAKKRFPDFPVARKYPRDPRLVAQEARGYTGGQDVVARRISALPGLRFEPATIRVPPGRRVALTVRNDDINMQHNLVVVRQERLNPIGEAAMIMAANPRAIAKHYVPGDRGVLALSPVLNPGDQYTIYFDAPRRSGAYPFICTFPGHWKVMRGLLLVGRDGDEIPESLDDQPTRKFVKMWKTDDLAQDAATLQGRSLARGRLVFDSAGCSKCHVIAGNGTKLGPDLTDINKRFRGAALLEQILDPSKEINKDYQTHVIGTLDAKTTVGLIVKEDDQTIHVLTNPLDPDDIAAIKKSEIEERLPSRQSTMPKGLLMTFERDEILDLLSFIQAGGKTDE